MAAPELITSLSGYPAKLEDDRSRAITYLDSPRRRLSKLKHENVFILGAGFSRAIGDCNVGNKVLPAPLDKDFFASLEDYELLSELLSDKPCLSYLLDSIGIYDASTGKLKNREFSLEKFWTEISLLFKLNSSITGFPELNILPFIQDGDFIEIPIDMVDDFKNSMSDDEKIFYDYISDTETFNPEGLLLFLAEYELKKIIFDVYANINSPKRNSDTIDKFKNIVKESPIISFNYDCLAENIFRTHKVFRYIPYNSDLPMEKLIIKPHGSLGWIGTHQYSYSSSRDGTVQYLYGLKKILRKPSSSAFKPIKIQNKTLNVPTPIMIPMCPGKENFVSGKDSTRIKIRPDNKYNKKREFIDCVVSYASMIDAIRCASNVIFIGYSFPATDYETLSTIKVALSDSNIRECHICVKGKIPKTDLRCKKIVAHSGGLESFVKKFSA